MRWCPNVAMPVAVAVLAVTFPSCSSSHPGANAKPLTSSTVATTSPTTVLRPAFTLDNARASARFIPAGFVAVSNAKGPMPGHVVGPIPGTTNDAQYFLNEAARQSFVMSVYRGGPLVKSPWMQPNGHRVHGRTAYVGSDPITRQREITWVVNSNTSAFVGGTRMSDEVLFRIANGMDIAAS